MTWHDLADGGGVLAFDAALTAGVPLELEVVVDAEEGLSWGVWWIRGSDLLLVLPVATA
jgi:hypothetical protein